MTATRTETAGDSRIADKIFEKRPAPESKTAVYVLVVHPDDTTSFVLDVYGSRSKAEDDKRVIEDESTSAAVEQHWVEAPLDRMQVASGGDLQ